MAHALCKRTSSTPGTSAFTSSRSGYSCASSARRLGRWVNGSKDADLTKKSNGWDMVMGVDDSSESTSVASGCIVSRIVVGCVTDT